MHIKVPADGESFVTSALGSYDSFVEADHMKKEHPRVIEFNPIGIIRSLFKDLNGMPNYTQLIDN